MEHGDTLGRGRTPRRRNSRAAVLMWTLALVSTTLVAIDVWLNQGLG